MNDLISRSETKELLRKRGNPYNNFVERTIDSMPAAYDMDKVVELEKENEEMKEVIRKLLCTEYGSSCQFCIQDNNDNAMCRKVGGSGSWCCENAAYDRDWNKK